MHNFLFCAQTLCMNYVIKTLLLVSSSVRSKQLLCSVPGQGQKGEQKHTTKNFVGFYNRSPLLIIICPAIESTYEHLGLQLLNPEGTFEPILYHALTKITSAFWPAYRFQTVLKYIKRITQYILLTQRNISSPAV